jgi:hypothetical protein
MEEKVPGRSPASRWIIGALLALIAVPCEVLIPCEVAARCRTEATGPGKTPVQAIRYQCPMHPSIISDRPGKCPICGMDLVPMKDMSPESRNVAARSP